MKLKDYIVILGAGEGETIHAVGRYVGVLSASANFTLIIDDADGTEIMAQGLAALLPTPFKKLYIYSDTAQTIKLLVTDGQVIDSRLTITGSISTTTSSAITSTADKALNNGAITTVIAANSGREAVTIKSLSTNPSIIRVGGGTTAAAIGHELLPGESITFNSTGAVYAYAPAAGNSVSIVEE